MAGQHDNERRLLAAASKLGLKCSKEQIRTLLTYMEQLQRWNRTYNLTALRDNDQILIQHLFDSLSVVPPLLAGLRQPAGGRPADMRPLIMDVGSGGGLPGIVIATVCPDWDVACVDSVDKKMAFVRQMAGTLDLANLRAIHARVESLPPSGADIVVSRAFASLADFALLAGAHVRRGGYLAAMKGRYPKDEVDALEAGSDWYVDRIEPLAVPELTAERCLIWMSHREGTP